MKSLIRFFILALIALPHALWADAPLSGTSGSNLTAFNGSVGAFNNNAWNQMINSRPAPSADFGNCNALILRCAQPKCATGGCVSMDIAYPIVYGCVMSTDACKSHGDPLIQAIAAQIVANSTARANEQAAGAQQAAADAIAAQSEQQMQAQMQQMQAQMAQQSAQSAAAVQAALEEQKQLAAQAAAETAAREASARAAAEAAAPAANIASAVNIGVSADVLAREQASGKIMTQLENAEVALKTLKTTMQNAFDYAGCDQNGNNCTGPKRVKAFKQKAGEFFDPYEAVLDEVYDALIMAQSLGVDITDIYMMLNGSCNVWGKYMCQRCDEKDVAKGEIGNDRDGKYYCEKTGNDYYWTVAKVRASDGSFRVAPRQQYCTLSQMLSSQDEVQQNWLNMAKGESGGVRVACASDAIENSVLFRGRKKQASIDIETLERMLNQDAPTRVSQADIDRHGSNAITRFCSVEDDDISKLQVLVQKKTLTTTGLDFKNVCIEDRGKNLTPRSISGAMTIAAQSCEDLYKDEAPEEKEEKIAKCKQERETKRKICHESYGKWSEAKQECDGCQYEGQIVTGGKCIDEIKHNNNLTSYMLGINKPEINLTEYGIKKGMAGLYYCDCENSSFIKTPNSCECPKRQ